MQVSFDGGPPKSTREPPGQGDENWTERRRLRRPKGGKRKPKSPPPSRLVGMASWVDPQSKRERMASPLGALLVRLYYFLARMSRLPENLRIGRVVGIIHFRSFDLRLQQEV